MDLELSFHGISKGFKLLCSVRNFFESSNVFDVDFWWPQPSKTTSGAVGHSGGELRSVRARMFELRMLIHFKFNCIPFSHVHP